LQVVRLVTELRAKHAAGGGETWGVDGCKGTLVDMQELGIWEPLSVKVQTMKTAIEVTLPLSPRLHFLSVSDLKLSIQRLLTRVILSGGHLAAAG
jgi:hypothetical protein